MALERRYCVAAMGLSDRQGGDAMSSTIVRISASQAQYPRAFLIGALPRVSEMQHLFACRAPELSVVSATSASEAQLEGDSRQQQGI